MKSLFLKLLFVAGCFVFSGFTVSSFEEAEFICIRTQKSANACYYNFKMGGLPYHFKDVGCKRKKDDVIKAVNGGELGLSKDWKIACPEEKKEEPKSDNKTDF